MFCYNSEGQVKHLLFLEGLHVPELQVSIRKANGELIGAGDVLQGGGTRACGATELQAQVAPLLRHPLPQTRDL